MVKREMKIKQQKKLTRVCIPIFNAETNKCFTAILSLDGLRVCANKNVIISESGTLLITMLCLH